MINLDSGIDTEDDDDSEWWMGDQAPNPGKRSPAAIQLRSSDSHNITTESEVAAIRAVVKRIAALLGFATFNQTKIVTASSELARNVFEHGGGGKATIQVLHSDSRPGIRLVFEDHGPGIADISKAMEDGFSTGSGMGLGLGGSKRLTDEFSIESIVGSGTKITITKWA